MTSIDPELRRREARLALLADSLQRRAEFVRAREGEWRARRPWRRALWALRLAPWTALELAAAAWLLAAAVLELAVTLSAVVAGLLFLALTLARVFGALSPRAGRRRR